VRAEARHRLKEDRFAIATQETIHWTVEHRNKLVLSAVIVGAVLALALGGWYYLRRQDQAASIAMGQALRTYQAPIISAGSSPEPGMTSFPSAQERAKAAQVQFRNIAAKYSHTRNGEIARYFAALADNDLGNTAAAEKELKEISEVHNADLASLAKFALASQYKTSGQDAKAIDLYKQLIAHPSRTVGKAEAQLELASLYAAKQPAEAKKIYEEISKDNPATAAAQIAQARMQDLK